jgi:hypothetical protein
MLDLMVVKVRWECGGTKPAGEYTFLDGMGKLGTGYFCE